MPPDSDPPEPDAPDSGPDSDPDSGPDDPDVVVTEDERAEEDLPDATLGGYFRHHDRPPAFEGPDGEPYTVSPEVEKTGELPTPYHGYLVFPRWAATGLGVIDHVESPTVVRARTREEALERLGDLPLRAVKEHLDRAVAGPPGGETEGSDAP